MSFSIPSWAKSWVEVPSGSGFPIQNLPLCSFVRPSAVGGGLEITGGVRIGDYLLDLDVLVAAGLIPGVTQSSAHLLCILDGEVSASEVRRICFELLDSSCPVLRDNDELREMALVPVRQARLIVPCLIESFVDYYAGIHHAWNVGKMFRPDQPPLLPNYRHIPIAYNGRASSVVASGTAIRRPKGVVRTSEGDVVYQPTAEMDFELELGFYLSKGNDGRSVSVDDARKHILGMCLLNDWSARDIQRFEYQPLGPFLGKSFATTVSPYIVSLDALEPFAVAGTPQDPPPLPHLAGADHRHYDVTLEVSLKTNRMKRPQVICTSNAKHLYWTIEQMLAHQTSNGTKVEPGDLYGTGTVSGPDEGTFGSMLELAWKGTKPIVLEETGETRVWLEDGDTVVMTAFAVGDGYRIGFGECVGKVVPAS